MTTIDSTRPAMPYRRLGRSGLQVSALSFGSWVTFGTQVDTGLAEDCLSVARDAGVNFFDNAEAYAGGESERIMGRAIAALGWERWSYVISTKVFWGIHGDVVNMRNTLNRKYLMHAIEGSLERLGLDFVDLLYCHRPDPHTTLEETVWAMSDIVASGKALYWGTSEWSADEIRAAWEIAERHHLHDDIGLGLTTWSPLASGLLTGKYVDGIPEGSRASLPGYEWLRDILVDPDNNAKATKLVEIARRIEVTPSQLAIAWCAANPNVSSVITGASTAAQVRENMGALDALARLTPELKAELEAAVRR